MNLLHWEVSHWEILGVASCEMGARPPLKGTSTGAVLVRPANVTYLAQSAWKNMDTVNMQKSFHKNS